MVSRVSEVFSSEVPIFMSYLCSEDVFNISFWTTTAAAEANGAVMDFYLVSEFGEDVVGGCQPVPLL